MNIKKILYDYFIKRRLDNAYRIAVELMVDRGYLENSVEKSQNKNEIIFNVEKKETIGEIDYIEKKDLTTREYLETMIDMTIDKPRYTEDESFEDPLSTENKGYVTGGKTAIFPGRRVSIPHIEDWVRSVKIHTDLDLQMISDRQTFDDEVDRITYKVARKIYYVGRKPSYKTPEEWDDETAGMRPVEGSYHKRGKGKELWTNVGGFPYGADYKYRDGMF